MQLTKCSISLETFMSYNIITSAHIVGYLLFEILQYLQHLKWTLKSKARRKQQERT